MLFTQKDIDEMTTPNMKNIISNRAKLNLELQKKVASYGLSISKHGTIQSISIKQIFICTDADVEYRQTYNGEIEFGCQVTGIHKD